MPKTSLKSIPSAPLSAELPSHFFTPLQKALHATGARILDEDGVRAYQAQKLAEARRQRARAKLLQRVLSAAGWGLGVITLWLGVMHAQRSGTVGTAQWIVAGVAAQALAVFCGVKFAATFVRGDLLDWRVYHAGELFSRCSGVVSQFRVLPGTRTTTVIPDEALALCRRLAEANANATAQVEQLDDDPFLFLTDGSGRYCVFAWDENGYVPR